VQTVSPGGPAAKAGLRSGDIITRLDGKVLSDQAGVRVAEEESPPGVRLIEIAAKLEPNDTIAVEFLRGSQRQTVKLITGDEPMTAMGPDANQFFFRMPSGEQREFRMPGMTWEERSPGPEGGERIEIMRRPGGAMVFGSGMLGDLELAPLNPDLGSYFGATEGVLVIRAPANPSLGLKGGDVVLSVDGRKPSGPSSLIRILRSYDEGDSFKLEVLRQKKRETITAKLGAKSNRDE
jgi:S1-C subfamily serine protease